MKKIIFLLFFTTILELYGEELWEPLYNDSYFSIIDLSYTPNTDDWEINLISFNFSPNKPDGVFFGGFTLLRSILREGDDTISLLGINLYWKTFGVEYKKSELLQVYDYFYLNTYPLTFKGDIYYPYISVGNELMVTQRVIPGTIGLGVEYNFALSDNSEPLRLKLFYKLGGSTFIQ